MNLNKNLPFLSRLRFAINGINAAFKKESSLRLQGLATLILFIFCLVVHPPIFWCALFIAMVALVLTLEMINSAVEALLDRLHPERHESIGFVKDVLAGATLIASIASVLVFLCYLYFQYLISFSN
ncbi:MAG: diacylglycerol kinase [Bdellovibrio sp.]|nr:diacylglycerol kinase [Bdellovibrio sp.]